MYYICVVFFNICLFVCLFVQPDVHTSIPIFEIIVVVFHVKSIQFQYCPRYVVLSYPGMICLKNGYFTLFFER